MRRRRRTHALGLTAQRVAPCHRRNLRGIPAREIVHAEREPGGHSSAISALPLGRPAREPILHADGDDLELACKRGLRRGDILGLRAALHDGCPHPLPDRGGDRIVPPAPVAQRWVDLRCEIRKRRGAALREHDRAQVPADDASCFAVRRCGPASGVRRRSQRAARRARRVQCASGRALVELDARTPGDGRVAGDDPEHREIGLPVGELALRVGEIDERIGPHRLAFRPIEHRVKRVPPRRRDRPEARSTPKARTAAATPARSLHRRRRARCGRGFAPSARPPRLRTRPAGCGRWNRSCRARRRGSPRARRAGEDRRALPARGLEKL